MRSKKPLKKSWIGGRNLKRFRHPWKATNDLWAKIVKHYAGNQCEVCQSTENLQAHHIFKYGDVSTRYDTDNGVCLCARHHKPFAHDESESFRRWLLKHRMTEKEYEALYVKSQILVKDDPKLAFIALTEEAKKAGIK